MLNEYLSEAELQSSLKEFIEAYNFLFSQIEPNKNRSIFGDKKRLAELHHSINLDKYSQKQFREKLLFTAPDNLVAEFAEDINVAYSGFEETKTERFRSHLANFQWGDNHETRAFVNVFGYPEYLIPTGRKETANNIMLNPPEDAFNQLMDYQANIVFKALDVIKAPNSRLLIHMPTGSGKTRVAMEIIAHFLNVKEGLQVVWLADKYELCEQAMDAFLKVWKHLGRYKITIHRIWGNSTIPTYMKGTSFAVAMYQKIRSTTDNLKADLIIADEAHIAIAPTYSKTINMLRDRRVRQTRIMGLTATPGRGSGLIEENQNLSSFFRQTMMGISDEGGTIESLQKKGILARCDREPLEPNIEYTLSREEWEKISKDYGQEFPEGLLEKIANDQRRNLMIIRKLREMSKDYRRIMVFCGSVKQSKLMASFMNACRHPSAYVDKDSPPEYRKDTVVKFKEGKIQYLFNYGVFTAGFDVPLIDAVVIARPTTSVVLYGQMIGRGMRGPLMGGTSTFTLIDVVDNIITEYSGLDNVHEYFEEYWA